MRADDPMTTADSYSRAERRFITPLRCLGARLLGPLVRVLAAMGIPPNAVSVCQIAVGFGVLLTVRQWPRAALLLFLLTLLLDVLDGALARYSNKATRFGMIVDQYSDHAREILVVAAMTFGGGLSPLLAVAYALIYPATNLTILLCNHFGAPLPLALKTYLVTYPAIFCYLWLGWNWLDLGVSISLLLMLGTTLGGLLRLRRVLT